MPSPSREVEIYNGTERKTTLIYPYDGAPRLFRLGRPKAASGQLPANRVHGHDRPKDRHPPSNPELILFHQCCHGCHPLIPRPLRVLAKDRNPPSNPVFWPLNPFKS